jgi:EmrB/QacA subfamily drug resistance transporter
MYQGDPEMSAEPSSRRWWALGVLATAQFMVIMDTSIIGVALPDMQRSLGFAPAELSWVFNAYVIAFGGLLLLGGKLSDLFGARRIFLIGFALLTVASLGAGLATTKELEIAARALQGLGAALIAPTGLALLMTIFGERPRDLTKAFAVYGAAAPAGGTAGVFLGGLLTETLSWPWVFYVNIPVGIAVLVVAPRLLPESAGQRGRLDVAGALTVTAALSLAVFAIVRAPEDGWTSSQTVLSAGASAVLLAAFVLIQRSRRDPLLPLAIFRTPNLAGANLVMALLGAGWVPMWYFLNLYLQQVLGYGPFTAGSALLPMTALMMVLMVGVTERLVRRFGFRSVLATGMVVLTAGLGFLSLISADGSFVADVLAGSLVAAVGMSLAYIPAMLAAMSGARPDQAGLASGIVNTSYQVGSALGLGAMTAVAASHGADELGHLPALTGGFSAAFVGAGGVALAGAALALLVLRTRPVAAPAPEASTSDAPPIAERELVPFS